MSDKTAQNQKPINSEIPEYGLLYFDHLQGEYVLERTSDISEEDKAACLKIVDKRQDGTLKWNDIYAYQLILLKYQDFETIKSKIIGLRIKYQNLAGTAEYNSYVALRAVDLTKAREAEDLAKLKADYKYLLDEFYIRYAYVATRENIRTRLLRYAAFLTLLFFVASVGFTIYVFYLNDPSRDMTLPPSKYASLVTTFSTLILVVFAGMMGAFVSMQHRLQTISNHGDPIYNLSLLTYGSFSIFLSPITGAIFAIILYFFFAGGLLKGAIFPVMNLDKPHAALQNTMTVRPSPVVVADNGDGNDSGKPADIDESNSTVTAVEPFVMGLSNFLQETGPQKGTDFALLIIWGFISGFAERLVPDTLMRLVNQKKSNDSSVT